MAVLVLLIVMLVVVFLLLKSVQDARARAAGSAQPTSEPPTTPARPRRRTPRREAKRQQPREIKAVDQEALAAHVAKLRDAIAGGLISMDEAAASVVRHTDGALSEEAARKLLETDQAA